MTRRNGSAPAGVAGDLPGAAVEPLFAHPARLWLRVWAATQAAALGVALFALIDGAGGMRRALSAPFTARVVVLVVLLVVYHALGLRAHAWMLRRTWAVLVFVPIGWALILWAVETSPAFGLLVLGAILQGFVFLPFAWAVTTLALVTTGLASVVLWHESGTSTGVALSRVGGVLATGVMIGTVILYIHRANREAALRTRLLRQLDDVQRDLADRARDAGVQEERQRFAQDIHDTLAQGFISVIKHLEAIELSLDPLGADTGLSMQKVLPHLAHAQAVSRSSLADIRRLVWALRPAELSAAPLGAALARIVAQWSDANAIPATFVFDPLPALQPDADVILLRATQESLSNVVRHANAKRVAVSLSSVDGLALLTVEDDGCGFAHLDAVSDEKKGLTGTRERVRRFGGHLLIESTVGMGTSVTVAMPLSSIAVAYPAAELHA